MENDLERTPAQCLDICIKKTEKSKYPLKYMTRVWSGISTQIEDCDSKKEKKMFDHATASHFQHLRAVSVGAVQDQCRPLQTKKRNQKSIRTNDSIGVVLVARKVKKNRRSSAAG